jgi:formamidopyrimidine-DNA glycosylase
LPEAPEVQIVVDDLNRLLKNDTITDVEVLFSKLLKNCDSKMFSQIVKNFNFENIQRVGKYILFSNSFSEKWLTIHLGMTGAFFIGKDKQCVSEKYLKHIHIIFSLESGNFLYYADIRKFGDIRFFEIDPLIYYKPFYIMGVDPLSTPYTNKFIEESKKKIFFNKEIKPSLLDSRLIAGIGNIYANEALFISKINPLRLISTLSDEELTILFFNIHEILKLSYQNGGSTISDYVTTSGEKGKFQNFHKIYQKKVCFICKNEIIHIMQKKRATYFCSICQPQF